MLDNNCLKFCWSSVFLGGCYFSEVSIFNSTIMSMSCGNQFLLFKKKIQQLVKIIKLFIIQNMNTRLNYCIDEPQH